MRFVEVVSLIRCVSNLVGFWAMVVEMWSFESYNRNRRELCATALE